MILRTGRTVLFSTARITAVVIIAVMLVKAMPLNSISITHRDTVSTIIFLNIFFMTAF
jgi:hypothetical protein